MALSPPRLPWVRFFPWLPLCTAAHCPWLQAAHCSIFSTTVTVPRLTVSVNLVCLC